MINKLAHEINLSFDISDSDKKIAVEISTNLVNTVNQIKIIENHIDLLFNAFNVQNEIDEDYLYQKRGAFSRYASKAEDNFKKLQFFAAKAIKLMQNFEIDNHISELIKSLTDAIKQCNEIYQILTEILKNTKTDDFKNKVINNIGNIKQKLKIVEDLIKDRIIKHIDDNILTKNWIKQLDEQNAEKDLQPVQNLLNEQNYGTVSTSIRTQTLNPAHQQQVWYAADRRIPDSRGE